MPHFSRTLVLFLLTFSCTVLRAQHICRGRVLDSASHEPVAWADIYCPEIKQAAHSDRQGHFFLRVPSDSCRLLIHCLGYRARGLSAAEAGGKKGILLSHAAITIREVKIREGQPFEDFHALSRIDLNLRPVNSSQDLMRLVPGLFIAQHMGGGKAEQIFIRGFDADHGTDLNVSVDGLPVNMPSHVHGQGYADLLFLIPETVSGYEFGKGPYYAGHGDFTTAGYLAYSTRSSLDRSLISLEGGRYGTSRVLALIRLNTDKDLAKGNSAWLAGEYNYTNGPYLYAEKYSRLNLSGKVTRQLDADNRLSISASWFQTNWRASGEIPERAVNPGSIALDSNGKSFVATSSSRLISRFGTIDSAQGGKTSRFNLNLRLQSRPGPDLLLENQLYYSRYNFSLHVNSTFFAADSLAGDERAQKERRNLFGYRSSLAWQKNWGKLSLESTAGMETRQDEITSSSKAVTENYSTLSTISAGKISQNNSAIYLDEVLRKGRFSLGLSTRLDFFYFHVHDSSQHRLIVSPKLNLQFEASDAVAFYLKAGKGFHSNNAYTAIGNSGRQTLPAAWGADLGTNMKIGPALYLNAAVWYLYLPQEFVYSDDGNVVPGGKTSRAGIDLSARDQISDWLFADLNVNLARPRLVDSVRGAGYLPLAPTFTSTAGLDFKLKSGLNGGLSYRYLRARPGNNTNSLRADGYFVTDFRINYTRKRYELGLSVENLFNTRWNEFEAEQVSRLKGEKAAVDQMSFTPGTPIYGKIRLAVFF